MRATAPRPAPEVPYDFWAMFDQAERLEELRQFRPAIYRALPAESAIRGPRSELDEQPPMSSGSPIPDPPTSMRIHQWVPAAHRGDAIGDSARAVRGMLRGMGHDSDIFALTIDDDLRGDVLPFSAPAATQRRRHDLSLRPAVADDRGVRAR